MKEKIYLSSDHAGYDLKDKIKKYLEDQKYEVIDLGTNNNYDSIIVSGNVNNDIY